MAHGCEAAKNKTGKLMVITKRRLAWLFAPAVVLYILSNLFGDTDPSSKQAIVRPAAQLLLVCYVVGAYLMLTWPRRSVTTSKQCLSQLRRRHMVLSFVLVLLAVQLLIWYRSHTLGDEVRRYREPRDFQVMSLNGFVMVSWGELWSQHYPPPPGWHFSFWPLTRDPVHIDGDLSGAARNAWLSFGYDRWVHSSPGFTADAQVLLFPHWFPTLVLGLLSALATRNLLTLTRREHRRAAGLCPTCGYDLRASSERCPECGTER